MYNKRRPTFEERKAEEALDSLLQRGPDDDPPDGLDDDMWRNLNQGGYRKPDNKIFRAQTQAASILILSKIFPDCAFDRNLPKQYYNGNEEEESSSSSYHSGKKLTYKEQLQAARDNPLFYDQKGSTSKQALEAKERAIQLASVHGETWQTITNGVDLYKESYNLPDTVSVVFNPSKHKKAYKGSIAGVAMGFADISGATMLQMNQPGVRLNEPKSKQDVVNPSEGTISMFSTFKNTMAKFDSAKVGGIASALANNYSRYLIEKNDKMELLDEASAQEALKITKLAYEDANKVYLETRNSTSVSAIQKKQTAATALALQAKLELIQARIEELEELKKNATQSGGKTTANTRARFTNLDVDQLADYAVNKVRNPENKKEKKGGKGKFSLDGTKKNMSLNKDTS